MKLYKIKFSSKCIALRKALKPCSDSSSSKEADKIIANEDANDMIDVTQYDSDINLTKRLMFRKVNCGSLSNRKLKPKGKTDTHARINFKKSINDVSNRQQRNTTHFCHAI